MNINLADIKSVRRRLKRSKRGLGLGQAETSATPAAATAAAPATPAAPAATQSRWGEIAKLAAVGTGVAVAGTLISYAINAKR